MDNNILKDFSDSILKEKIEDTSIDIIDFSIDALTDSEIIGTFPVVKTLYSLYKSGLMIKERYHIEQTIIFMNELNSGRVPIEKREKFSGKLKADDKEAGKIVERILLVLESTIDKEKSLFLARLTGDYINEKIDMSRFQELSDMINRFYLSDITLLNNIYKNNIKDSRNQEIYRIKRLESMGILDLTMQTVSSYNNKSREDSYITINSIGEDFCRLCFI